MIYTASEYWTRVCDHAISDQFLQAMQELGINMTQPLTLQNQYELDCLSFAERNAKYDGNQAANVDRIANIYNDKYKTHVSTFRTTKEQPDWPVCATTSHRIILLRQKANMECPPFTDPAYSADRYGISTEQLNYAINYVAGSKYRTKPEPDTIEKIAAFHDVTPEYLQEGIIPKAVTVDLHDVVRNYVAKLPETD